MKKILSLFVLMLAMVATSFAAEKTVWEGSEPISWNTEVAPGTQFATPEGTFTGLAKGDIIRAYTTTTYDAPQYVMTYMKGDSWDWTDLETTVSDGVMTYTVADETIATEIATRWIVFRGQAYTLTKITVETPESGGETTGTVIWEGSTTLDWGADPGISVSLEASKFANAKAGDVLKIEGTAQELIQVQVCVNYPWKSSDSYTALPISYTIAEEDLDNIKANGMTIAGQYATISKVTLTTAEEPDPDPEVTQYTLTVTQPADGTGSIQINGVDATTQQYDENTVLELVAVPIANYQFDQWISTTEGIINEDNKSVSPLSVTMDKDIDISAAFSVVNGKILDWKHEYASNGDYDLSSVKAGDIVRITFVQTSEDGGEMYLKVSAKDESWGYSPTFHDGMISTTTYDIEVTEDYQTNIAVRGLFLQGNNITITNIEIVAAEPEPATPVFDENGKADLSKIEVQDAEKVSYDAETHTVTTTEGWTGVQLTVADGEEVSGKELRVTFDREMKVKCYVKYTDETDADVIMDKAEKILYFTLDETKKLYQVQIQPTDAATFAFEEIKVNQESTKPEPEPEPGEKTRTENAQKLFDVLTSLYGNKIISGTTAVVDWNTSQAEQVNEWTGNYPAINTYDFINLHASKDVNPEGWLDYSDISGVKKWASEGGLVSAMWHWQVKNNAGTGYTCTPGTDDAATSFDASKVYVDGTAENTLAKQQLSQICGYLKKMQDAGIPVIWRPLHEAAGNTYEYNGGTAWFWWGAQGADVYKQLWQWMYNYMVNEQGLNNLIWVWTSQTKDGSWYPGNAYVDIIGRDSYGGQAAQQKNDFDALTASYPNMMVALSECGNTNDTSQSDISTVWETGAKWSWFSTWYDAAGNQLHNTQDWWTNAFNQDYVVTRAQMKELLDLNIEPDPEPQPEPGTNTFDENGIADLSKIEVQNAEKVTYDAATHTVTTTEGWTGVQLTVADGEQVSGKELRVTFDRAMRVKCYVKYLDETDADVIMDDAAEILYFELDNTKKLYQVQIQPTEAATFAFDEIRVNAESTKPVLKPLEEGEVRTLFEDEEGVVMAWNEICQMDAEWGAILEAGESFLITIKSRTEGSEWPKVILRDANSEGIIEVGLAEVSSYPYIVKMVLTDDVVAKLRNGFRFSGDGITITKIEISKPAPVKEGDVSIEAMNWFRNATYDAATHTGSTSSRWGQFGWAVGDDRYADMTLVIVTIEETSFPVTLKMEYTNTDGKAMATSMGVAAGKTQLNLPLPLDTKVIKKVYLTYADAADVVLTDASVIAGANARPLTGYEDDGTTAIEEAIVNALSRTRATGIYYDLQGRRVQVPVKGLYIVNGKKVIK